LQELEDFHSFRDPDGYVFQADDRLLRYVHPHAAADLRAFLSSSLATSSMDAGQLVHTKILESPTGSELPAHYRGLLPPGAMVVEHKPITFRTYPYEWSADMLRSAAELTLELGLAAMRAGFVLKDATPYNVMFDGSRPVFLDVLSFRRRDPLESIWQPYAQFFRTFILPLLACRYFGLQLNEILLAHRDGIEPDRIFQLCPFHRLLLPPFLSSVTIPVLLTRGSQDASRDRYRTRQARDAEEAEFILERLFARLGHLVRSANFRRRNSEAVQYMSSAKSYDPVEFADKERFVSSAFERFSPKAVLDMGCNTGHFSLLAARRGARVVAIDRDPDAAGALWQSASKEGLGVLPLVVDIGWPPGACGWRNNECAAFLDRARSAFDCVLMLALIHHLLVNERVPLAAILQLAAGLTTDLAMVEYIDPSDPLFQQIARGRDALHRDLTREAFETAAGIWFDVMEAADVNATRRVYILRKKGS
jgi:SAM-dependent methyltransferase